MANWTFFSTNLTQVVGAGGGGVSQTYTVPAATKLVLKRLTGVLVNASAFTSTYLITITTGGNAYLILTRTTASGITEIFTSGEGGANAAMAVAGATAVPVHGWVLNAGDTIAMTGFAGASGGGTYRLNISGVKEIS